MALYQSWTINSCVNMGVAQNYSGGADRRFRSMFPLTFWYRFLSHSHIGPSDRGPSFNPHLFRPQYFVMIKKFNSVSTVQPSPSWWNLRLDCVAAGMKHVLAGSAECESCFKPLHLHHLVEQLPHADRATCGSRTHAR